MPRSSGIKKEQLTLQRSMQQTAALMPALQWKGRLVQRRGRQANQQHTKLLADIDLIRTNVIKMQQDVQLLQKVYLESKKQMGVMQELAAKKLATGGELKEDEASLFEAERKKGLLLLDQLGDVVGDLQSTCDKARDEYLIKYDLIVDRVRLYAFAVDKLNIPFDDLEEKDVESLIPEFKAFLAEKNRNELVEKEDAIPPATRQSNVKELSKKQKKKQKYKEKQKTKALALKQQQALFQPPQSPQREAPAQMRVAKQPVKVEFSPQQEFVDSLNHVSYPLKYSEAPRCVRWRKKRDPREFGDSRGGKIVYHYQGMTQEALDLVIKQHKLHGVDRVLSNPEAVRRHGLSYHWRNESGVLQEGIKFPTIMHLPDSRSFLGWIKVGFNPETNVIFHAMFEAFEMDEVSSLAAYRESLEEIDAEDGVEDGVGEGKEEGVKERAEKREEGVKEGLNEVEVPVNGLEEGKQDVPLRPWQNVSPVTFNPGKKGSLLWEVGEKVQDKVTFEVLRLRD